MLGELCEEAVLLAVHRGEPWDELLLDRVRGLPRQLGLDGGPLLGDLGRRRVTAHAGQTEGLHRGCFGVCCGAEETETKQN